MSGIEKLVQSAVAAIERDISDRRGLKWEWGSIDDDVKEEIRAKWAGIISRAFVGDGEQAETIRAALRLAQALKKHGAFLSTDVAPSELRWTPEQPTVEGWYLVRSPRWPGEMAVFVEYDHGRLYLVQRSLSERMGYEWSACAGARWCGPINAPRPTADQEGGGT